MKERLISQEAKEIPGILRIGVDLDGIVADVVVPLRQAILEKFGFDINSRQGKWDYWFDRWPEIAEFPDGPEYVRQLFQDPEIIKNAIPIKGAILTLNHFWEEGHQLWFITARAPSLVNATKEWLGKNNLSWAISQLVFREGTIQDSAEFKRKTAEKLYLHVFIDDYTEYIRSITNEQILIKLILSCPWNIKEEIGPSAKFCQDWQEIKEIIDSLSRWHYFLNQ